MDDATYSALKQWAAEGDLQKLILAVILVAITAVISHFVTKLLRHLLRDDDNPLPAITLLVNIARATIWIIGICLVLSICFNVDVTAAVAALGVGGIAISLGLKDTISNLIGGLQITFMGLVRPGDNIRVGSASGIVRDVTWRQTLVHNADGRDIIIPNSVINATTVEKLWAPEVARVTVSVNNDGRNLDAAAREIEAAATAAASGVCALAKPPKLVFTSITEFGMSGLLTFTTEEGGDTTKATDAVIRAIAPLTRAAALDQPKQGE